MTDERSRHIALTFSRMTTLLFQTNEVNHLNSRYCPGLSAAKNDGNGGGHHTMDAPKTPRGRPRKRGPNKVPVTIRIDIDLLDELKASGPGWQTRVNNAVRDWVFRENPDDEAE
jgi:uncharacterized protein (DUF4415 family)